MPKLHQTVTVGHGTKTTTSHDERHSFPDVLTMPQAPTYSLVAVTAKQSVLLHLALKCVLLWSGGSRMALDHTYLHLLLTCVSVVHTKIQSLSNRPQHNGWACWERHGPRSHHCTGAVSIPTMHVARQNCELRLLCAVCFLKQGLRC